MKRWIAAVLAAGLCMMIACSGGGEEAVSSSQASSPAPEAAGDSAGQEEAAPPEPEAFVWQVDSPENHNMDPAVFDQLHAALDAGQVYAMLSGTEATTLNVNGNDLSVKVEYGDDQYDTIDKLQGIVLPTATGSMVALTDIAEIGFKDSPQSIMKSDKQYQVTISGQLTDEADLSTDGKLREEVIGKYLNASVSMQQNTMAEMMEVPILGIVENMS